MSRGRSRASAGLAFAAALWARLALPGAAAEIPVATPEAFAAAVRQAQPGQTLVLAAGEWRDADLLFQAEGTPDLPITLRAAAPGAVVFTGASRLRLAGRHLVATGLRFQGPASQPLTAIEFRADSAHLASHCRVTECVITDYSPADAATETKWVSLYGSDNRVDHCYLAGKSNGGTTLVVWVGPEPNRHRIDHNHFGPRAALGRNGGETIRVGSSAESLRESGTLVEDNLFTECNGEIEIVSNKSCGNLYRRNTFRRCEGSLTLRHGNRCTVEGNVFLGENARRTGGIRVIGEGHRVLGNLLLDLSGDGGRAGIAIMQGIPDTPLSGYAQVREARIAFNTLVNVREPFEIGTAGKGTRLPPVDCVIANNLVQGGKGPAVRQVLEPERLTWAGNLLAGELELGLPEGKGWRRVGACLERTADGDWQVTAASPAINAADALVPPPAEDIDGQPRPADGSAEVGCDELSDAPRRWQPLTVRDTGPAWFAER